MRDEVEMELRGHARLLIKVADAIAAEDGLLDKPEPWGQHDPNPFVPLMLFLAMRRTRQAVADVRGNPRGSDPLLEEARDLRRAREAVKVGRASCRDRVCQYVSVAVVAGSLKKKQYI